MCDGKRRRSESEGISVFVPVQQLHYVNKIENEFDSQLLNVTTLFTVVNIPLNKAVTRNAKMLNKLLPQRNTLQIGKSRS